MDSIETIQHRDIRHLVAAAGRAHHAVYGGPNEGWAQWYAEWIYGELLKALSSDPSVDQVRTWLIQADERYRSEAPDSTWPGNYADWLLEWDADEAAV